SSKPVSSSCPRAAARAGILLVPRVCRRWCGRSSPRAFRPSWALCGTWRTPQRNRCRCLSIVTTNRAVTLRWHYRPHSANCSGTETAASGRSWRGLRFRWSVTDRHRSSRRHNDLMEEHTLDFIVRILFTGMMVFIPNSNGTQLDVVLLNVGHAHAISDGTTLTYHKPLLLARAGGCTGTCPKNDAAIATFVFGDKPTDAAVDALEAALDGGGAWQLTGSDVSVVKGSGDPDLPALDFVEGVRNGIIPTTSGERMMPLRTPSTKSSAGRSGSPDPLTTETSEPVSCHAPPPSRAASSASTAASVGLSPNTNVAMAASFFGHVPVQPPARARSSGLW